MKTLIATILLGLSPYAFADGGFTAGNDFEATWIEGEITLRCDDASSGRSDFAHFRCTSEILDPAEYSYFKGPQIDADKVTLLATREDGSTREKSGDYDATAGKSKSSFNLWISTLLQRPLLKTGKNEISWKLTKEGAPVAEGKFDANVKQGKDRSCKYRRTYFSSNINDCSTGGFYCDRYFQDENYCQ